jgi:hypothetical protein
MHLSSMTHQIANYRLRIDTWLQKVVNYTPNLYISNILTKTSTLLIIVFYYTNNIKH